MVSARKIHIVLLIIAASGKNPFAKAQEGCRTGDISPNVPSTCAYGDCDGESLRNQYAFFNPEQRMVIRINFIVFGDGINYIVDNEELGPQMEVLNEDYRPLGIEFEDTRYYVHDPDYRDLCINCPDDPDWNEDDCCFHLQAICRGDCDGAQSCSSTEEEAMKAEHSQDPDEYLNIYVLNNAYMNYAGLSYFPWCGDAADDPGGIIMHYTFLGGEGDCNGERCTWLTHEVGHALGLWHTQRGVNEVDECGGCYERPYPFNANCASRGDFCCDTPPTPPNYTCSDPGGSDSCTSTSWGDTAETNYMGYGGDGCVEEFTPEQARRMHCWVCNSPVSGWIDSPDCNESDTPDVCDTTSGLSLDYDENGIPDECESGACCMSNVANDCEYITESQCMAEGLCWYGLETPCGSVNCVIAASCYSP